MNITIAKMKVFNKKQAIFFSNNCYFFQNPYNIELTKLLQTKGYKLVFCVEKQLFPITKEYVNSKFIDWPSDLEHRIKILKNIKLSTNNFLQSFVNFNFRSFYYLTKHFLITLNHLIQQLFINLKIMLKITWEALGYKNRLFGNDEFGYLLLHELSIFIRKSTKNFISHELYFDDEIDPSIQFIKDRSHKVAINSDLILSTDVERYKILLDNSKYQKELQNLDKICIPVGYHSFPIPKAIQECSNNILYTGTISATCGVDEIVELFSKNKRLFSYNIHFHSYHMYNKYKSFSFDNISFNCTPIAEPSEYIKFVSQFDIGLALYFPDQNVGAHFGKNINFIGYSSGKFSLLAMLSIPIIVSANNSFLKLKQSYDFGIVINSISEIDKALDSIYSDYDRYSSESRRMYEEILCPESKYEELSRLL